MNLSTPRLAVLSLTLALSAGLTACGSDEVSSDEQARAAYLGLDPAIEKSLGLGFAGFNAASSANIPTQTTTGNLTGTLTINGQVDQGNTPNNKGMRLRMGMVGYTDGAVRLSEDDAEVSITYATVADVATQPALTLSLRDIPNGTFTGTLVGTFQMTGDLEDEVILNLQLSGAIEDDGTGKVRRKAGSTTVTGTATSGDDTYDVNVTL
jgi:hypothetical protein